jgi:hypothetical protein
MSGTALLALALGWPAAAASPQVPDICLSIGLADPDAAMVDAVVATVEDGLATRPVLLPSPFVVSSSAGSIDVAVWAEPLAEDDGPAADPGTGACPGGADAGAWTASIAGSFLRAGTKRELAAAGTTPGFSSSIDVEWDAADDRVRTVLTFSGPLDIPNGMCWMDDVVSADGAGGTRATTTTDSLTSPFGDGVCGRFEAHLADGGAGAQALVLLPRAVRLPDGSELRLAVDGVDVRDDGIGLWGRVSSAP